MLDAVKMALPVTVDGFDMEILDLIQTALMDLETNGVNAQAMQDDPLILQAVKTYCKAHFRTPPNYDQLMSAYDAQKGHLMKCARYTNYTEAANNGPC